MAKSEMSVSQLVAQIEKGYIQKPEMQREYVWKSTRVRDLLDSLYRNYPSGTILLWEADNEVPTTDFAIKTEKSSTSRPLLLLDGQQRLTSLSSVLRGEPVMVRDGRALKQIDILFNLEHPDELSTFIDIDDSPGSAIIFDGEDDDEEDELDALQQLFNQFTFIVSNPQLASAKNWVNVSEVFKSHSDSAFMKKAGVTSLDDPLYTKYSNRLQKLRGISAYVYRLDILEPTLSYEEVTEIFIRVNSLGVKLRSADLALAQITAKWHNSLVEFQNFQKQTLEEQGFFFDLGFFVRGLVICATGQSRFKTLGSVSLEDLQAGWTESKRSITFALNFLKSNLRIDSLALLTSPFIVFTVAFWGSKRNYKVSQEEARAMRRWILISNTKSRYSQSAETLLDQDLSVLKNGGAVAELLERLSVQFGRLDVTSSELQGRRSTSGYFKAMFLAFREDGAKDWYSKLEISAKHSGMEDKLQFHHIFPKAFLKKNYPDLKWSQVNDISNLAFIGGKTNREIRDKAPSEYLRKIIASKDRLQLELQAIPLEGEILDQYSFDDFVTQRRKMLVKKINKLLS